MSSRETDLDRRAERGRAADQALADDRRGRNKLADQADEQLPDKRGRLAATPNTPGDEPL
jgi:hypothetical protein